MLSADERVDLIRGYGDGYDVFVETGTASGFTTLRLVRNFKRLITIELDYDRYVLIAAREFMNQNTNVLPLFGDSARVLPEVLEWLDAPAIFWLDAHYCGDVRGPVDSPADTELEMVLNWSANRELACTVLIDDARFFVTEQTGWPTLTELEDLAKRFDRQCVLQDDVVRIT